LTITNHNVVKQGPPRRFISGRPVSPGEVLHEEFLAELGLSQRALAAAIRVPPIRVSEIVRGKRAITVDTALRLAIYFGTTPELWLNLQAQWDLSLLKAARREDYALIPRMRSS